MQALFFLRKNEPNAGSFDEYAAEETIEKIAKLFLLLYFLFGTKKTKINRRDMRSKLSVILKR